jgi:MFS family permease
MAPEPGSTGTDRDPDPAGGAAGRTGLARLARLDALALVASVWFLAKLLRYAIPPLFGTLQASYGVSTALLGTTYSALMIAYAAMQFPSGALADRVGGVRVVAGGAAVGGAATLALAVPGSFAALVAGMVLFGIGTGALKTVSVPLIARTYASQPGRALGAYDTVGALGGVVAPVAVVALLPDWRRLYLLGGVAGIALAVAVLVRVSDPEPASTADSDDDARTAGGTDGPGGDGFGAYLSPFRDRRFAAFAVASVLFTFATGGVLAFLPLFLETEAGLSRATAGTLYGAVFAGSVAQLATGELGDRIGHLPIAAGTIAAAFAGLVVVALAPSLPVLAAGVVLLGAGVHGLIPVRGAYMMRVLPAEVAGGGLGVVRTTFMIGSALAPAIVGAVADAAGLSVAVRLLAAVAGLATLVVAGLFVAGDG